MAFNIALSGLNAVNSQLSQISNNIANSGTYGFKSGRANFAAAYMQAEVGGVYVGSTSQTMTKSGNVLPTGRGLDAAIQGRGFFVSRDTNGMLVYSRMGMFNVDKEGYVVDAFSRRVQGYGTENGGVMGDLSVPTEAMLAEASTSLRYAGNMSADWTTPALAFDMNEPTSYNDLQVSSVYDSLGRQHTLTQYFVKGATTATGSDVDVYYALDGVLVGGTPDHTLNFGLDGRLGGTGATTLNLPATLATLAGAEALEIDLTYTGTTYQGGRFTTTTNRPDGNAPGTVIDVGLGEDGSIQVQYSNGSRVSAGTLTLAVFPNELALNPVDGTAWQPNSSTGEPIYGAAGAGLIGALAVASLESSNVDMATELVNLMTAQQNYQANSKVLSTESEMMRTLMQSI
ncbi:flagellar hook-basal body complex protein [Xanthomonas sp. XNM01]|uniref:flagellar hook-basal body complex protein n=1 Tax=Xanthomonas sp. XNM01 TaxID=2769289 RepID=UPI00177F3C68|nr:flagellar hook-basal body complex protein [Xanthomonas sp. XNM01]MBD9370960.1 flagellar hook-basal body complex protein [Xanthomonas sp. XNM01]